jgi:hypothetical protein
MKKWVNTPFNRRLKDFIITYREGSEPFDPLPYIEESLLLENKNFDYLIEQDPSKALEQIFHSLVFSQSKVVRDIEGRDDKQKVKLSETLFGKLVTSVTFSSSTVRIITPLTDTCQSCSTTKWEKEELHTYKIPFPPVIKTLSENCL